MKYYRNCICCNSAFHSVNGAVLCSLCEESEKEVDEKIMNGIRAYLQLKKSELSLKLNVSERRIDPFY
ncbi:MAG: hypothetical protein LBS02_03150 [Hungatella sp.]|nr:hypothetical protein [Hungatella sp.]